MPSMNKLMRDPAYQTYTVALSKFDSAEELAKQLWKLSAKKVRGNNQTWGGLAFHLLLALLQALFWLRGAHKHELTPDRLLDSFSPESVMAIAAMPDLPKCVAWRLHRFLDLLPGAKPNVSEEARKKAGQLIQKTGDVAAAGSALRDGFRFMAETRKQFQFIRLFLIPIVFRLDPEEGSSA